MSYISNRNLTDVVGRIDYISNPKRQENIIDFYNSQDNDFWLQLAKENQEQFKVTSNSKIAGRKAAEAREFIIALPQDTNTDGLAEFLCNDFKNKYGVDCACAIHYKSENDNLHAHLIYSERERLTEPLVVEPKVAPRTYYYDAQGKKCKKADAVKVVTKGTVIKKGNIRYFGNKIDFFKMNFVKEYKAHLEKELKLPTFDNTRYFATKHVGKYNPKGKFISEYNELIGELNDYFNLAEQEYNFEISAKQEFCKQYDVPQHPSCRQIAKIKKKFDDYKEEYPLTQNTAESRFASLSDDELLETYKDKVQWLTEAQSDYSYVFQSWDCPMDCLEKNAKWEKNKKHSIQWDEVDRAIERINKVVYDNGMDIALIPQKAMPSEAVQFANSIMAVLQELIEYLRAIIKDIVAEIFYRDLDINIPNDELNELYQNQDYEIEYE